MALCQAHSKSKKTATRLSLEQVHEGRDLTLQVLLFAGLEFALAQLLDQDVQHTQVG